MMTRGRFIRLLAMAVAMAVVAGSALAKGEKGGGKGEKSIEEECGALNVTVHVTNGASTNIEVKNTGGCPVTIHCSTGGVRGGIPVRVEAGAAGTFGCGQNYDTISADCGPASGKKCKLEVTFL